MEIYSKIQKNFIKTKAGIKDHKHISSIYNSAVSLYTKKQDFDVKKSLTPMMRKT